MNTAFLWFEVDKSGGDRVWHVRGEFGTEAGVEVACKAVRNVSGETITDGKKRRLPVNHALHFDHYAAVYVDPIIVRGRKRSA